MSNKYHSNPIEKEFELERVILFSDAVFAIAITLLVIDIKWPDLPAHLDGVNLPHVFRPTILAFLGFALSFFFIGRFWIVHLRICRLLRKYDQGLIIRNLLFLFGIVIFPFAASGLSAHVRDEFTFPIFFYLGNITMVTLCHFLFCRYVMHIKPELVIEGEEMEKKYIYLRARNQAFVIGGMFVVAVAAWLIFPDHQEYVVYMCALTGIFLRMANRKLKKYKPAQIP
jgi:TMEM175 potassium channel family protein